MKKTGTSRSLRAALGAAGVWIGAAVALLMIGPPAGAYDQYTQNGGTDATNCGFCHGDFRATDYVSETDGMSWGNLHNLHRNTMLTSDCNTCHSGSSRFPVILNFSSGGNGLSPIACVGCHGRNEDNVAGNPEVGAGRTGYGAGLRQHHYNAGVQICAECHLDADPASYTPVGENVLPDYYANPGSNHPSMPTDPCNPAGGEDFAGDAEGLDNDGDDVYDGSDSDCLTPVELLTWGAIKATFSE